MIIWQEKQLADDILASQKNIEKNKDYWAVLLTKYWILKQSGAKTNNIEIDLGKIRNYFGAFIEKDYHSKNKEDIEAYIESLISEKDIDKKQKRVNSILKSLDSLISSIMDGKTDKVFFNDKPITIYQSEVNQITEVGKKFRRPNGSLNLTLQKYLFVWLVWQKAYNNQFSNPHQWCIAKDEDLFKLSESKESNESGQRCNNFKKLIENGYISYDIQASLAPRERFPNRLFKVNFIINSGEKAFEIRDYQHIFEHYLKHIGKKFMFCEKCGTLFAYQRNSRQLCNNCAR